MSIQSNPCSLLTQALEEWRASLESLRGIVDTAWKEEVSRELTLQYENQKKEVRAKEKAYSELKESFYTFVPETKESLRKEDYDFVRAAEQESGQVLFGTHRAKTRDNRVTFLGAYNLPLKSLPPIPSALETLDCSNTQVTSLDLSKAAALERLSCHNTQLISLDLSKAAALKVLSCYNTQLASLDLSKAAALEWLDCSDTQLASISPFPLNLTYANLRNNQFSKEKKQRIRKDARQKRVALGI